MKSKDLFDKNWIWLKKIYVLTPNFTFKGCKQFNQLTSSIDDQRSFYLL